MLICQGCGQALEVPEGYSRNKIQCLACGVISPVPAGAARAPGSPEAARAAPAPARRSAAPVHEDEAAEWLKAPEPTTPAEEPVLLEEAPRQEEPPEAIPVRKPQEMLFPCRRCGRLIRKQRECPSCDGFPEGPLPEAPPGAGPLSLELDEPSRAGEEEDATPYLLADKELPRCPKCHKEMAVGAVICTSCGFNLKTRKKVTRSYEPISRSWDTDMTLPVRLGWLAAGQGVHFFLMGVAMLSDICGATPFLVAWPLLTGVLCFVLGTYDRIDLERDTRGRVKIIIRWRFCFVPTVPREIEVRGYEGVTTGQWHDAGFLEWFVCISLVPLGVIPAAVWWYHAIYKEHYHVALARDHGAADEYVYRGRSAGQMAEITEAICNATGMRNVT
jgi:hypothetical protein